MKCTKCVSCLCWKCVGSVLCLFTSLFWLWKRVGRGRPVSWQRAHGESPAPRSAPSSWPECPGRPAGSLWLRSILSYNFLLLFFSCLLGMIKSSFINTELIKPNQQWMKKNSLSPSVEQVISSIFPSILLMHGLQLYTGGKFLQLLQLTSRERISKTGPVGTQI